MTRTIHTRILDALPTDRFVVADSLIWRTGLRPSAVRPALTTLKKLGLVQSCRLSHTAAGAVTIYRRVRVANPTSTKPASGPRAAAA